MRKTSQEVPECHVQPRVRRLIHLSVGCGILRMAHLDARSPDYLTITHRNAISGDR